LLLIGSARGDPDAPAAAQDAVAQDSSVSLSHLTLRQLSHLGKRLGGHMYADAAKSERQKSESLAVSACRPPNPQRAELLAQSQLSRHWLRAARAR